MVKQRRLDDENVMVLRWKTMLRWWKYDGTIWWNCDGMLMKTRYNFSYRVIAASWFSPSFHCVLIIAPSYNLNFTFVPLCIAVQGDKNVTYVQTEHRNRLILNDTISWLVSHLAEISRLAKSRVSLRISFVDARQEIDSRVGPLCLRHAFICIPQKLFILAYFYSSKKLLIG
jgi:hypothetical protein